LYPYIQFYSPSRRPLT